VFKKVGRELAKIHQIPTSTNNADATLQQLYILYTNHLSNETWQKELDDVYKEFSSKDLEESIFIHGDFHGENIIVNDENNEITGIIDWEQNVKSHRYFDIIAMIHYIHCMFSPNVAGKYVESFIHGYELYGDGYKISKQKLDNFDTLIRLRNKII
jgi:aminoglycoside phosphotransferase (APT) family kinase protein